MQYLKQPLQYSALHLEVFESLLVFPSLFRQVMLVIIEDRLNSILTTAHCHVQV